MADARREELAQREQFITTVFARALDVLRTMPRDQRYDLATVLASPVEVGEGKAVQLEAGDPDWLSMAAYEADGSPARQNPVSGGYFEIAAPPGFLSGESTEFRLEWVDFYR